MFFQFNFRNGKNKVIIQADSSMLTMESPHALDRKKYFKGQIYYIWKKPLSNNLFFPGPEIKYTRITAGGADNEEKLKKILQEG